MDYPDVKIERVYTYVVHYAVREGAQFKFFEGMGSYPRGRTTVVVRLRASDGTEGWGQSVPSPRWSYETIETVETTIRNYLTSELVGVSPFDESEFQARIDRAIAPSFSRGQPICKAALDLARFDLAGRILGQSAFDQWQVADPQPVTLSWTLNADSLDALDLQLAEAERRGYRHFNLKIGDDADLDFALCQRVRQAAPEAFFWADANGGYDLETALRVAPRLAELGLAALEQPLPANQLSGYRRLTRQAALPIVMDEPLVSLAELREFHQMDLLNGAVLKVARSGGLTESRKQLAYLREHGLLALGSGLTDPDLSLAASALLFSAGSLDSPVALNGPQYLEDSILQSPLTVVGDQLHPPTGPGLGVEVDRELMRDRVID